MVTCVSLTNYSQCYSFFSLQWFVPYRLFVIVENGTYWAAARYLEAERVHPNRTNKSVVLPPLAPTTSPTKTSNHKSKKRKYSTSTSTRSNATRRKGRSSPPLPTAPKRYKKSHREDAIQYMTSIQAMIVPSTWPNIVGSVGDSMVQHRTQMIQKVRGYYPFFSCLVGRFGSHHSFVWKNLFQSGVSFITF